MERESNLKERTPTCSLDLTLVVEGRMTRRVTPDDKYSSSLHPCGRRLRRRRRRRDRNINNAIASVTTLLDADIHVGCTAVGGRHHNSGRGRRLLHRRGNAARRAIRRRLVAITSTKRRLHLRNTATSDDEPITHAHTRMWTRNECARATNVHAQDMRIARVRHVKVKVKLPSTRG